MNSKNVTKFDDYAKGLTESDWLAAVNTLLPSIHEVDRNATQIWFHFHPFGLRQFLAAAADRTEAEKGVAMQGDFELADKIDTSHEFLFGNRYWPVVKTGIQSAGNDFDAKTPLADKAAAIAHAAAQQAKADVSLLLGITIVGLATAAQVGSEAFSSSPGQVKKPKGLMSKSPNAIVQSRKSDDSQGLLGFLKTINKSFSVVYDEPHGGKFKIMNDQEIASASANDRSQNWQAKDERCWEGPVPVECTSASCGTCWVGILGGEDKLSDLSRRERRAIKVFGYDDSEDQKPIIRLACQAKASGNVTLVIPPWNAVFGKKVYGNVEDLELEPVTTSAKALREAVREATASGGE